MSRVCRLYGKIEFPEMLMDKRVQCDDVAMVVDGLLGEVDSSP